MSAHQARLEPYNTVPPAWHVRYEIAVADGYGMQLSSGVATSCGHSFMHLYLAHRRRTPAEDQEPYPKLVSII